MGQVNNVIKESIFRSVFDEQVFFTDLVPWSFTEDEVSNEEASVTPPAIVLLQYKVRLIH